MPTAEQRRIYNQTYYRNGGAAKVVARNKANRQRNAEYVRASKEGKPCVDCGKHFPFYAMDYDHVHGDKINNIGTMVNDAYSIAKLQAEIDKCELVCAICHRIRTWDRLQVDRSLDA